MSASGPNWAANLVPSLTAAMLTQSAGGVLGATTYFVKITYVDAMGESLPSGEQSKAVAADNVLNVASPPASGLQPIGGPVLTTGWNVYVSTSTGTEVKQNSSPIAIGTPWVEPTSGLIGGAAPPTSDGTSVPGHLPRKHY